MRSRASPCERASEPCSAGVKFFQNSLLTWFVVRTYKPLPETMEPTEKQGGASKIPGYWLGRRGLSGSSPTRGNPPVLRFESPLIGTESSEEKRNEEMRKSD